MTACAKSWVTRARTGRPDLDAAHAGDDLAADLVHFERVLSGASNGFQTHKRFVRKDGRVINVTTDVKPVRQEDRRVDFFVATVRTSPRACRPRFRPGDPGQRPSRVRGL
ncbi:MAG: PAS domain S-box protein [Candidatus Accumulibacter sp.]|uniref:PAS domain S-box protein n=1 Tax=Candidatus Accumulibacter affinis TaxID=2954384 RepID=A0A935TCN1_9PROT|nr:PAS domain S-box protein [Candidatus Accumulibacter affinis]